MSKMEDTLKFLLKEAKLQGFVGISQIKENAQTPEEENFLRDKLSEQGIEINFFLRTKSRNYKTTSYVSKKERSFLLTTRVDENGESFLLDGNGEKELFERMNAAKNKILSFAQKTENITDEDRAEIYESEQIYSTAKREIIEANIRLVFSIAKDYSVVHKGILDISDIIQEGNIGLIEAIESFDFTRGNKFSSWATWYIRRQIWTAINSFKKLVYVPPKASVDLYKISLFEEKYKAQNGKKPDIQEIAQEFEITEKQVVSLLTANFDNINSSSDFYESNGSGLSDEFDENSSNPLNLMVASGLKKNLDDLLEKIGGREQEIIKLYFGLNADRQLNLAQIGEIYGISRERVRQIIEKTLENIKEINAGVIKEYKSN